MQQTSYQKLLAERQQFLKAAGLPVEVQKELTAEAIIEYLSALLRLAAGQMNAGNGGNLDPTPATAPATKSIVGQAVAKAVLTGNRFSNPNLAEAYDFGGGVEKGAAGSNDSFAMTERIRKRREADGIVGGPTS